VKASTRIMKIRASRTGNMRCKALIRWVFTMMLLLRPLMYELRTPAMLCGFAHQRGTPHRSTAAQQTRTICRPEQKARSSLLPAPAIQAVSSHHAPITNLSPTRAIEGAKPDRAGHNSAASRVVSQNVYQIFIFNRLYQATRASIMEVAECRIQPPSADSAGYRAVLAAERRASHRSSLTYYHTADSSSPKGGSS
jgi:hypothetical protein